MLLNDISGSWYILDPAERYQTVFSSQSYDEAKFWLLEDEYECVRGQVTRKDSDE